MSLGDAAPAAAALPITDLTQARALMQRMQGASQLALDTEGDGMFRYRTRLCTVQLAADGEIAVLDTLALPAAPLLCELLGENGPEKIIHDAAFDARVLFAHGVKVARVFDTAIAARFLALPSTGLSALLARFFGLHLPKHQQMADWGLRPISGEAMRYLEDDVRHLNALAQQLLGEVRARDIEAEVRVECDYVLSEAQKREPPEPAWMRIKGVSLLPPQERARLVHLADAREQLAQAADFPPARLIHSDVLLTLARACPDSVAGVARFLGQQKAEHAGLFFDALKRAEAEDDAPVEQLRKLLPAPPSPAELSRKKRRKAQLMEFREKQAKARGVDVQVVLPGHCLSELVDVEWLVRDVLIAVPGFGECRVERYGALLADLDARWRD